MITWAISLLQILRKLYPENIPGHTSHGPPQPVIESAPKGSRHVIYIVQPNTSGCRPTRSMAVAEKSKADPYIIIENLSLGVWNLKIAKTTCHIMTIQWWRDVKSGVPLFYRLASDVFTLAPRLFTFFVFCRIWGALENSLLMHFSSLLLRRVCHDWLYSFRGL